MFWNKKKKNTVSSKELGSFELASQWELIRIKFFKHKLAVISLNVLAIFYIVAIFSEFFAPYPAQWKDLPHAYCPPQTIKFSLSKGFHTYFVNQYLNPKTLRKTYSEDENKIVPLGFFVKGEKYELLGLFPMERHFFGIDLNEYRETYPESVNEKTIPTFYLIGADKYGQDLFSRIILGSRISLSIGIIGIIITFFIGLIMGGVSGYVGGRTDLVIQRIIEIKGAFPQLPLWLALAASMPDDWPPLKIYFGITICLSLLNWTGLARVVRGKILSLREEDYAVAARLAGSSHTRVIFRHLLPGFTSHIIVTLSLTVPGMILGETTLSFLGLGLKPPVISWGVLLKDCMNIQAVAQFPWLLLPSFFVIIVVLAFNFMGDGLRDAADPYSSK